MAQRRMFSLKIIDTDAFLDMPATAQALYFHMAMRADDDGFVGAPKKIMRMTNAADDDYRVLLAKQFIIPFESGVCVIRHWRIHNYIQSDRYQETIYRDEKQALSTENGHYNVADTLCIQNVSKTDTQVRLGKVSIGKSSKSRADARHPKLDVPMNQKRYDSLCEKHGSDVVDDAIQSRLDWETAKGKQGAKDYAAAAANWLRNEEKWEVNGNGSNPDFVPWDPDEYDRQKEREREQSQRHG